VSGAKFKHLLGFSNTPDHGAGNAAAVQNQWKGLQQRRLIRSSHENHGPVGFKQVYISVVVVRRGTVSSTKSKCRCSRVNVSGCEVRAKSAAPNRIASCLFRSVVLNTVTFVPNALAIFTAI
jgi:hypothetical protein